MPLIAKVGTFIALVTLIGATPVNAKPRGPIRVVGQAGACPAPEVVAAELQRAMPGVAVGEGQDALVVGYVDLGARYNVFVGDTHREFTDPERRCDERARAVAVLVALVLEPPSIQTAPPSPLLPTKPTPPSPLPVAAAQPTPAPMPPTMTTAPATAPRRMVRDLHIDLDASGLFAMAPATPGLALSGGGALRASLTVGHFGLALGAGGAAPALVSVAAGGALLTRVPVDLDVRGWLRKGRVEGTLDLGLAVSVLVISGQGFSANQSNTRIDPGLRAALGLRVWMSRFYFLATVEAFVSASHPLTVNGVTLADTPPLWLQATAGVGVRLR